MGGEWPSLEKGWENHTVGIQKSIRFEHETRPSVGRRGRVGFAEFEFSGLGTSETVEVIERPPQRRTTTSARDKRYSEFARRMPTPSIY